MRSSIYLSCLFLVVALSGFGQTRLTEHTLSLDESSASPAANIQDFAWLEGRWTGQGFGGELEEVYGPPQAGAILATFRLVKDNQPVFYELCLLAQEGNSLVYKVKHFNPDLTGWEEKDEYISFPLVKMAGDTTYFHGITFVRAGDACTHYLAMKQKDGSYREAKTSYKRAAF